MAYTPDDPAKDRRITRLSLIGSAADCVKNIPDANDIQSVEQAVLTLAMAWESWILEFSPGMGETGPPAPLSLVCATCALPLGVVAFRDGRKWSPNELAQNGMNRHGRVLCKTHYFEANKTLQAATP